jgi:hypothetical protein
MIPQLPSGDKLKRHTPPGREGWPPNKKEGSKNEIWTTPAAGDQKQRPTFKTASNWDLAWSPP